MTIARYTILPLTGARVPLTPPAKPHRCGIRCTGAGLGTVCECECAGLYHATLHIAPELRPGYRPSTGDPFARLPQHDDEGAF